MADTDTEAALRAEIARLETELARAADRIAGLEIRADSDPLTELRNRHGFERELKRSLSYVARYDASAALAYFDLDGFKAINDAHGHAAGDAVLRGVAAVLTRSVRASDAIGRLGGDEFAVLMWHLDPAQALTQAQRLETAIAAARFDYEPHGATPLTLQVGVSCGVAALDANADFSQVLDAADRAMYARKQSRRGTQAGAARR